MEEKKENEMDKEKVGDKKGKKNKEKINRN